MAWKCTHVVEAHAKESLDHAEWERRRKTKGPVTSQASYRTCPTPRVFLAAAFVRLPYMYTRPYYIGYVLRIAKFGLLHQAATQQGDRETRFARWAFSVDSVVYIEVTPRKPPTDELLCLSRRSTGEGGYRARGRAFVFCPFLLSLPRRRISKDQHQGRPRRGVTHPACPPARPTDWPDGADRFWPATNRWRLS